MSQIETIARLNWLVSKRVEHAGFFEVSLFYLCVCDTLRL